VLSERTWMRTRSERRSTRPLKCWAAREIASEGRKAEWEDLLAGSQSDFKVLTALIGIGISVVGLVGYLVIMTVRRTFTDVIRINSAIAGGRLMLIFHLPTALLKQAKCTLRSGCFVAAL
jgi:hypothetical protein